MNDLIHWQWWFGEPTCLSWSS